MDRLEREFADTVLNGNNNRSISGSSSLSRIDNGDSDSDSDSAVSRLLEISERFGWDNEDKVGWSRVNFELLGTSKGGKIPRRSSFSSGGVKGDKDFSRVENDKVLSESEERRRGRRERAKLKKQVEKGKDKIEIVMKSKDGFVNRVDGDGDGGVRIEGSKSGRVDHQQDCRAENSSRFPGRESLLKKVLSRKNVL